VQSAKGDLPSDSPATLTSIEFAFLATLFLELDAQKDDVHSLSFDVWA